MNRDGIGRARSTVGGASGGGSGATPLASPTPASARRPAAVGALPPASPGPGAPATTKQQHFVDAKVAARNLALNMAGGVKVDVFVRVRPHLSVDGPAAISPDVVAVEGAEIALQGTCCAALRPNHKQR
jgi:hypothetical protein